MFTHTLTVSSNAWFSPPAAARLRPTILFLASDSFEHFRRRGAGDWEGAEEKRDGGGEDDKDGGGGAAPAVVQPAAG